QEVGSEPGEFDISLWPFQGTNPRQQFRLFHSNEGSFQEAFSLNDPEIDGLVEAQEGILDHAEWIETGRRVQQLLCERWSNWIPTYSQNSHDGYYAFVRGFDVTDYIESGGTGRPYQLDMWIDL